MSFHYRSLKPDKTRVDCVTAHWSSSEGPETFVRGSAAKPHSRPPVLRLQSVRIAPLLQSKAVTYLTYLRLRCRCTTSSFHGSMSMQDVLVTNRIRQLSSSSKTTLPPHPHLPIPNRQSVSHAAPPEMARKSVRRTLPRPPYSCSSWRSSRSSELH